MPEQDESSPKPEESGPDVLDHQRFFLAAIVESSDDAIISKNLQGIVTTWNQAANRIFGYTAEEMIGQPILRLIPEEMRHEEDMILMKLRAGERIDHYETTRIRKDGERFEISVTISPIRDSQGRIIGASKTARDISERKKIEQLLIQSEKLAATGRMAATIAHEINNPLESVMNLVFLAHTSDSISKARGYLQTAEKELERVAHIVRQTLGYYRETAAPVQVDLRELMQDVLTVYQTKLSANRISVDFRFDNHRPIIVNKGELVQVLSNVVANAIDAMPHAGVLHIHIGETTNSQKEGVQIVIRDNGTGIPQEHLSRIFEPFFTTKGNLGTGIGLWVARQLIEKQHGQIAIASCTDPENHGTTLSLFLPFADPQSTDVEEGDEVVDADTVRTKSC
jgi:PAS domain S-box-containing protein